MQCQTAHCGDRHCRKVTDTERDYGASYFFLLIFLEGALRGDEAPRREGERIRPLKHLRIINITEKKCFSGRMKRRGRPALKNINYTVSDNKLW
jgi:hypothetical protein